MSGSLTSCGFFNFWHHNSKVPQAIEATRDLIALTKTNTLRDKPLGELPNRRGIELVKSSDIGSPPTNPGFTVTAEDRAWDLTELNDSRKDAIIVGPA